MLRGLSGMAGGGIYFAETKPDTANKAMSKGYLVVAEVKLGRQMKLTAFGDRNITFQSLLKAGYDSVLIPRTNGNEHVVYNYDQVLVLEVKRKKRRSKW